MTILTFDDGSTLDTEWAGTSQGSTVATNGSPLDFRETMFNAAGSIPSAGAPSWADMMKGFVAYGVPRLIDNAINTNAQSQIPPSQYINGRLMTNQQLLAAQQQQAQGGGNMLLLVAAGIGAVLLAGS